MYFFPMICTSVRPSGGGLLVDVTELDSVGAVAAVDVAVSESLGRGSGAAITVSISVVVVATVASVNNITDSEEVAMTSSVDVATWAATC